MAAPDVPLYGDSVPLPRSRPKARVGRKVPTVAYAVLVSESAPSACADVVDTWGARLARSERGHTSRASIVLQLSSV